MAFTPPPNSPGPKEIAHRTEQAARILQTRQVQVRTNAVQNEFAIQAVIRGVIAAGLLTEEQLNYYLALVRMEAFEKLVVDTTPAPRILVPGRDS